MSVIDKIMQRDIALWICDQIKDLPDRAKYCAYNSVRSLEWANNIFEAGLPIPASYCALHATEEAVAAFIYCAKECGYGDIANINTKDHAEKATISLFAEKITKILKDYNVAIAFNKNNNTLTVKFEIDSKVYYQEATTKLFSFRDDNQDQSQNFYNEFIKMFSDTEELKNSILSGQEARVKIFYATKTGLPTGFLKPEPQLERECQLSLGLIWAAVDIKNHKGEIIPFIDQALRTANMVIAEFKSKKKK
ncbi:MAG: hypothetical protein COC00_006995 [Rhizobiales bacterium]|nr:hypothetical protein [Hyphomicrobiales bacterium]